MGLASIHLATAGTAQILVNKSFRLGVVSRICGRSIDYNQLDNDLTNSKYLIVSSHPMDEIHKLLEVQLCPGERISHKELATVPIEVSLQPDRYLP